MPQLAEGTRARTESLRVKLSAEMLERLESYAVDYGMPSATMAAFAIADWITKQDTTKKMTRMAVLEATRGMGEQFGEAQLEKAFTAALPQIFVAMADAGHTVDAEAVKALAAK